MTRSQRKRLYDIAFGWLFLIEGFFLIYFPWQGEFLWFFITLCLFVFTWQVSRVLS